MQIKKLKHRANLPATKVDLGEVISKFATSEDLARTEQVLRAEIRLSFKEIKEELEEKISLLPTKDEFYTQMDKVMGELKTIREEQLIITARVSEHSDILENHRIKIEGLEHKVNNPQP